MTYYLELPSGARKRVSELFYRVALTKGYYHILRDESVEIIRAG